MLRSRYRPGWVPESQTTGKDESECEDSIHLPNEQGGNVRDATRISDGMQVALKFVETASEEAAISKTSHIGLYFDTLGMFPPDIVVGSDICMLNIVVDASRMIPGGFHFIHAYTSDGVHHLTCYRGDDSQPRLIKTRTDAGPMKYYYTDFELAVRFPSFEARGLVTGYVGHLRYLAHEFSDTVPYDAFKVDVRLVGEMMGINYLSGMEFLAPLVGKLRHRSPKRRLDAEEALRLFR
ncbi:hypothetical protein B0H17DRAFT_1137177 [Mycena rosella]|uniref:Protein kinase domain-containing protein n=1 Tax=Mycena rosella TaxID=1033263 RepID=A0AAD7D995_MYCRO|nr:hypothetical protein B0H17DRAFT_1137177 [Mycena rosella]